MAPVLSATEECDIWKKENEMKLYNVMLCTWHELIKEPASLNETVHSTL